MFIIPNPQHLELKDEKIKVSSFCVLADCDEIYKFADCFNDKNGSIKVTFNRSDCLNQEHYKIEINQKDINVLYGDLEAAYRAVTTLKQIFEQQEDGEINCLCIEDYPSIKNRGYMLDVSRGKLPKLEYLKNLVDTMADLKYNQLQLYMDSFVYDYKNFPEYVKDTDPITRKEIMELDEYCKERFINLVPNQNGFGHMEHWIAKKELSHLAITGKKGTKFSTLNPLLDESLELVDRIYDGFADSFSSKYMNIGMDEPAELGLNETEEICKKYGVGKVYTDYLKKICQLCSNKYNKIPMFWDDIVFKHEEQIENLPKDAVVMHWGYETEHHYDRNCRKLSEKGLRFYVCPGTSMWGSYTGRTNNCIVNMSKAAECGNYYGAEGFLLTEWGDNGHPQFPSTALFPLTYGAAVSWNCGDHNVEIDYALRRNRISDCKKYLDKYLYNCKGEKSLADIVCRMGNYYLLEDALQFNCAGIAHYTFYIDMVAKEQKEAFGRVRDYMISLRKELELVDADEICIKEIKSNCDMVILVASKLAGCEMNYKEEFKELKDEFEKLWLAKNRRPGIEMCMDKIEQVLNYNMK